MKTRQLYFILFFLLPSFALADPESNESQANQEIRNTITAETESSASSTSQRFSFDRDRLYLSYGFSNYYDITSNPVVEHNLIGDYKVISNEEKDISLGVGVTNVPLNSIRNPSLTCSYVHKFNDDNRSKLTFAYDFSYLIQPVPSSINTPDDVVYQQNKMSIGWSQDLGENLSISMTGNGYLYDRNLMSYIRSFTNLGLISKVGRLMVDSINSALSWDAQASLYWYFSDPFSLKLAGSFGRLALLQNESSSYSVVLNGDFAENISASLGATNYYSVSYQFQAPNYSSTNSTSYLLSLSYAF